MTMTVTATKLPLTTLPKQLMVSGRTYDMAPEIAAHILFPRCRFWDGPYGLKDNSRDFKLLYDVRCELSPVFEAMLFEACPRKPAPKSEMSISVAMPPPCYDGGVIETIKVRRKEDGQLSEYQARLQGSTLKFHITYDHHFNMAEAWGEFDIAVGPVDQIARALNYALRSTDTHEARFVKIVRILRRYGVQLKIAGLTDTMRAALA